jgi:hypothetical protein
MLFPGANDGQLKAYVGGIRVKPSVIPVLNEHTEYTFSPAELATGSSGYLTEEGVVFDEANVWNKQNYTYQVDCFPALAGLNGTTKKIIVEYEIRDKAPSSMFFRKAVGGDCWFFPEEKRTIGTHTIEFEGYPAHLGGFRVGGYGTYNSEDWGTIIFKSVRVENVGGNPVRMTVTPFNTLSLDNKIVMAGETADILANLGETFKNDKVYVATINYKIYPKTNAANAPVLTMGGQTLVLKRAAGTYSASIGITKGATAININAKDATVVLGEVSYVEAGEDYAKLQNAVTAIPTTLKLDKTLAQTPAAAEAAVKNQLVKAYGDKYDIVDVTLVDSEDAFIPYEDGASVATASAAANGSVTVIVSLVEKATALPCTMTLTFDIVAKTGISDYNAATGDSAIVAVVALVALVSLAGVVVAKKRASAK